MVRVVHLTSVHPAFDGRIFYREALSLRRLGYEVIVYGRTACEAEREGVLVRPFPASRARLPRLLTSWWKAVGISLRTPADLYHLHDPELLPAGVLLRLVWRKRVVFDAHEDPALVRLKPYVPHRLRSLAAGIAALADRLLTARLDGVVTATERLAAKYGRFARRCTTFHNFPAPLFLEARDRNLGNWAARRLEVVHLGTASLHRLPQMLSVARRFLQARPGWTFRFFGVSAAQREACVRLIEDDCGGRLIVEGALEHEQVARVLCGAQVGFNFHLLDSEQVRVALPVKVLEYLACGLPTVSTRVPLLLELFEGAGVVSWCDDTVEDALRALVETADRSDKERVGREAMALVDKALSCRVEAERLSDLYRLVLPPSAALELGPGAMLAGEVKARGVRT